MTPDQIIDLGIDPTDPLGRRHLFEAVYADPFAVDGEYVFSVEYGVSRSEAVIGVLPAPVIIGADFTQIEVESYGAGITQGVGIGAEYTEIPVTSFAASIIQGLRIQAAFTQIPVVSYSAEIVDGSIVRPNRMDCSVRPYYQITASVRPYYDITATIRPYYDITATVNPAIQ